MLESIALTSLTSERGYLDKYLQPYDDMES